MEFRRKLLVLDKAHALFLDVNRAVPGIRRAHHQPLKTQLVKTALSIGSNIAEGRKKKSEKEFVRYLNIALGSSGELEYQLKAATDGEALPRAVGHELGTRTEEISKMLQGLIKKIEADIGEDS
ncbi:MAG: four helix bundle protein [Gemmatimonadaceae bacterium]